MRLNRGVVALGLVILSAGISLSAGEGAKAPEKAGIIGAWRLLSSETIKPNGMTIPNWMGKHPKGMLIYLPSGHFSVQIMQDPPLPIPIGGDTDKATPAEKAAILDGYYAYFGTYQLDAAGGKVTQHPYAGVAPEAINKDFQKTYQLDGDHLTVSSRIKEDGEDRIYKLTWERIK